MKYVFPFICLLTVVIACKKDKLETKPSLKLKSTTDKNIPPNGNLKVVFEYTDKEGDLNDTLFLFYKKVRLNVRTTPTKVDSFYYKLPKGVPRAPEGEILLTIDYTDLQAAENPLNVPGSSPPKKESDSLNLKFAIRDKAKHTSDTVTITGVVVQRN